MPHGSARAGSLWSHSQPEAAVLYLSTVDFPDAYRVNLWVQHLSDRDSTAEEALSDFTVSRLLP